MKETFADACMERAEEAKKGPWMIDQFAPLVVYDIPELAKRLRDACSTLRVLAQTFAIDDLPAAEYVKIRIDELEQIRGQNDAAEKRE